MLGYVQADTVSSHAVALESTLKAGADKYCTCDEDQWILARFTKAFATYRTSHTRTKGLSVIVVLHTFLDFRER